MPKASPEYYALEKRYLEATEAWIEGEFKSVEACAGYYGLKRRTLRRRVNGGCSKSTRFHSTNRLNEDQEDSLIRYLKRLDDMNMSPTPKLVVGAAKYILQKDNSLAEPIGKYWFTRFFRRHPELKKTTQRPLDIKRKDANFERTLTEYFEKLRKLVVELSIQPDDL